MYDDCVPLKKCKRNKRKDVRFPWITKGLLKSINVKNKLYKKYLQKPCDKTRNSFKKIQK